MMHLTFEVAPDLLVVRWDAPGTDTSYVLDDRNFMRGGVPVTQWRWLIDFRLYGDLSPANAHCFFDVVMPDEARRLPHPLRVAVIISLTFQVIPASIPVPAVQQARGLAIEVFTSEGPARQWVTAE